MSAQSVETAAHPQPARLWRALRTAPAFIFELKALCEAADIELYVPTYPRRVAPRRARRERTVLRPMFPGYGFLPCDQEHRLAHVPTFRYQVVRQAEGTFAAIDERGMCAIADVEAELNQFEVDAKPVDSFDLRDRVKITGDLFDTVWIVSDKTESQLVLSTPEANWDIAVSPDLVEHVAHEGWPAPARG